jgi:hypothetical protein
VPTFFSRAAGRWVLLFAGLVLGVLGCQHAPIDLSEGPARLRMPRPGPDAETYEDSVTGGELFSMYCNQCHNARALGERPFVNYQNALAHMRVRSNLTGEEYEKLLAFLRRWHDIPNPNPPVDPSPKRVIPPQPISELRDEITAPAQPAAGAQPAGAGDQPPPIQAEPLPMPARAPAGR